MTLPLDDIKSDEFIVDALMLSTSPNSFERLIRQNQTAIALGQAIHASPEPIDDEVDDFVQSLLDEFERGRRFKYDVTLATLAAVLDIVPTQFAGDFLNKLDQVQIAEMPLAPRVAQIALRNRAEVISGNTIRTSDRSCTEIQDFLFDIPPKITEYLMGDHRTIHSNNTVDRAA